MIGKDKLGQDLAVGDTVTYGVRDGNSGAIRIGIVKEIKEKPHKYHKNEVYYKVRVRGLAFAYNGVVRGLSERDGHTTTDQMVKAKLPKEFDNMLHDHLNEWQEQQK